MFIHVPKCGGRTIKQMLKKYVSGAEVIGDDIYESHATPDTDKQVFGFIRHPATFIHSLWTHRSKKKTHGDEVIDNMEKYKYMMGQAHAYLKISQEISNLLKPKEQNDTEREQDLTNVVRFGDTKD